MIRSSPPLLVLSLFSTYRFATARHLQTVNVPILVMHGDRDTVIPYQLGRELFDGIRGPKTFVRIAVAITTTPLRSIPNRTGQPWKASFWAYRRLRPNGRKSSRHAEERPKSGYNPGKQITEWRT